MANSDIYSLQCRWVPPAEIAHALKVTQRRLQHAEQHAKCASLFADVGDTVALRDAMIARMHATRAHKLRNTLHLLINGVRPRG